VCEQVSFHSALGEVTDLDLCCLEVFT